GAALIRPERQRVAYVAEHQLGLATIASPDVPEEDLLHHAATRRGAQLLEQQRAQQRPPGTRVVLARHAVEQNVVVDAGELEGDDRVGTAADADLTERSRPLPGERDDLRGLRPGDERLHAAVVECGELRRGERLE